MMFTDIIDINKLSVMQVAFSVSILFSSPMIRCQDEHPSGCVSVTGTYNQRLAARTRGEITQMGSCSLITRIRDYVIMYTVNHKNRGSLFLTITLANLNRFL